MTIYRDIYCGKIKEEDIEKTYKTSGWVENIRDHGGIIFIDLRDESGLLQLVSNDQKILDDLTKESVITVTGKIRRRSLEDYNYNIETGTIELVIQSLEIISKSLPLPFDIKTSHEINEEIRLKYRYLDLRNKKVHNNIVLRSKILSFLRNKMESLNFIEIQTPIITASSPEGARDFIVPSRKYPGKFYALPQAPQIFKQLLMTSGFDKYYQIAPCFRDEDCRSDRTLEFYQLDFEMAFVTEEDIYSIGEEIFYDIFTKFSQKEVNKRPFQRISYNDSLLKYGTDKPDLRNPLIICDVTDIFTETEFKPFKKSTIRAIKVENIANNSNSWFNEIVDYASSIGMPGIGYISIMDDLSFKGPIDKFLTNSNREELIKKCDLKENSVLFFIADRNKKICERQSGLIRTYLGEKLNLIDNNKYEFCIITDFPMYEYDLENDKYVFMHNPFNMPKGGIKSLEQQNIEDITAIQYDFVCNGNEMASGAVRNHDIKIMEKAFSLAGYSKEEVKNRFKSLYMAFQYGVPPHAGMAPGIDRIIMLLQNENNLREVQAFPISPNGEDKMMGCPSELTEEQLREVHIKIR